MEIGWDGELMLRGKTRKVVPFDRASIPVTKEQDQAPTDPPRLAVPSHGPLPLERFIDTIEPEISENLQYPPTGLFP
jgi:hypothetical protein